MPKDVTVEMIMEGFHAGKLQIDVRRSDTGVLEAWWRGVSDDRQPTRMLSPWFTSLIAEATKAQAVLDVHFEDVEYANSATIGAIVQLIKEARASNVKLRLYYSADKRWQEVSFRALRTLDKGDHTVHFEAKPQP
jgi:hypothetical protein